MTLHGSCFIAVLEAENVSLRAIVDFATEELVEPIKSLRLATHARAHANLMQKHLRLLEMLASVRQGRLPVEIVHPGLNERIWLIGMRKFAVDMIKFGIQYKTIVLDHIEVCEYHLARYAGLNPTWKGWESAAKKLQSFKVAILEW
jgi:hypothetical protein